MFIKLTPGQKGSLNQAQAKQSHDSAPFSCSLLSTNACTAYATRCTPGDTFRAGTRPSRWTSHRPWPSRARWTGTRSWSSRLSRGEDMTQLQQQAPLVIQGWDSPSSAVRQFWQSFSWEKCLFYGLWFTSFLLPNNVYSSRGVLQMNMSTYD